MFCAENLFHFKIDQDVNSIKPEDHGKKPLFKDEGICKTMLNEFFFYVFSKVSSWQSMKDLEVTTMDDVQELLMDAAYAVIPESRSGPSMPEVPVVSRNFISYISSFLSVAPFFRSQDAQGSQDAASAQGSTSSMPRLSTT